MVIRSRGGAKPGKTRTEADKNAPVQSVNTKASGSADARRAYSSRTTTDGVRYRSDAKQGKTRIEPVVTRPSSNGIVIAAEPVRSAGNSPNTGNTRSSARSGRAQPSSRQPSTGTVSRPAVTSRPSNSSRNSTRSRSSHSSSGHRNSSVREKRE